MEPRGPPLLLAPPVLEEEPAAEDDDAITDEPAALDDVDAGAEVPEDVALEDLPGRLVDPTDDDDDDDSGDTCELDRATLEDTPDTAPDDDVPPPDDGADVPAAEDATPDEEDDEEAEDDDDEDPAPDVAVHPAATTHIIPSPPRAARILPPLCANVSWPFQ